MARIVNDYDLGVIAKDYSPSSFGEVLQTLDHEAISKYKQNANKHAQELSSEATQGTIRYTIKMLLK